MKSLWDKNGFFPQKHHFQTELNFVQTKDKGENREKKITILQTNIRQRMKSISQNHVLIYI